jgi:hypothetical protein
VSSLNALINLFCQVGCKLSSISSIKTIEFLAIAGVKGGKIAEVETYLYQFWEVNSSTTVLARTTRKNYDCLTSNPFYSQFKFLFYF